MTKSAPLALTAPSALSLEPALVRLEEPFRDVSAIVSRFISCWESREWRKEGFREILGHETYTQKMTKDKKH